MPETTDEKGTRYRLRKADLKFETEAMLCAALEQSIRITCVKHKIDKTALSPLCRMCDKKSEAISHIVSECEKLAQNECKRRQDNVARIVNWKLCRKYNSKRSEKWYEHAPEGVVENEEMKVLWDVMIQCDREIKARKPDIVVVNKNERSCAMIDIAIPGDIKVSEKEKVEIERYQEQKREIKKMLNIRSIKVIPVVVGTLDSTSKKLKKIHRRTGSCYKHSITAENSTARDSYYIKEGFRLPISFMETALGGFEKEKKRGEWGEGEKLFQKLNS